MSIQQSILINIIDAAPKAPNFKFDSIMSISKKNRRHKHKYKQNMYVFMAAETILANANRIPMDAPNSGPIVREIMK